MVNKESLPANLESYLLLCYQSITGKDVKHPAFAAINSGRLCVAFETLDEISKVSKKVPIITDTTLFIEKTQSEHAEKVVIDTEDRYDDIREPVTPDRYEVTTYAVTSDFKKLTKWYDTARTMMNDSRILYIPSVYRSDPWLTLSIENPDVSQTLNPHKLFRSSPSSSFLINDRSFLPLFELKLPYIDGTSLDDLNKLMRDHPDKLLRLRNFLLDKIQDIPLSLNSENFGRELARTQREMDNAISELNDRYRAMRRVHIFETIGATLVPWVLTIHVFFSGPDGVLQLIGPGGMIASVSLQYSKYLKEKFDLGREPVDFLLLIGKSAERVRF